MRQASGNLIRGAGQDSCSGVLSLLVESPVCTCGHGRWCSGRRNEGDGSERTQGERPRASERSGKGLVDQGAATSSNRPQKRTVFNRCGQIFPGGGMLCEKPLQKIGFRRALLLIKPAHTGHHPGAVPGFRPSPGNSEETTTRVLTEEISVLFRVPTWDPTHPGSPVSRALPGNTPTQGPTREGKPGFFLGGGGNPGITQVRT